VDAWNQRIQKFSPDGKFLLALGGRGGPWGYDEADGKFIFPYGVAVDSRGYIYVSDFNNHRLQMFDAKGEFVMKWGTKGRQDGQVNKPAGLAMDSQDRLYLADFGNSRIQRFVIVEKDDGFEPKFDGKWGAEDFDRPYDVSVDPEDNFYVADLGGHSVSKFSPSGHPEWVHEFEIGDDGRPSMPVAVAAAGGDVVYVCDLGRNRIAKLAPGS
jgi:tripartite motif-containing protein 71